MKKTVIIFVIALLIILSSVLVLTNNTFQMSGIDLFQFLIIALLVGFALFIGFSRLTSTRRGEPVEDELSKKIMQRTAAYSYYISLYLWVFMIILKDRVTMDTEELLGMGILGMAITFALCWIVLRIRGIRND